MKSKNLLSVLAVGVFILFALASKVNKLRYRAFNSENMVEEKNDKGNYVELSDGTRVYGEKISWKSGLLVKDVVKIDDHSYKIDEVKGYREGDTYYIRIFRIFIQRIVHGRINVYMNKYTVNSTSNSSMTTVSTRTDYYAQKGEDGPLNPIIKQKDIKRLVADCPIAAKMANVGYYKMYGQIQKNPDYLNQIFEIYNNDCQPLTVDHY